MDVPQRKTRRLTPIGLLYVANLVFSLHLFLAVYINSNFLTQFIDEQGVGVIFILGSTLGVLLILSTSYLLRRLGNYKTLILFGVLQAIYFLTFAFSTNPYIVLPLFVIYLASYPIVLYNLDIFMEVYTKEESITGTVRGTFLTLTNVALVIGPLIAGFLLIDGQFWRVYILGASFLVPFFLIIRYFRKFEDPLYHPLKIKETFLCIRSDKNLYSVLMTQFLMRLFFSWMVIYMPIYLVQHIGFSWTEFGVIQFIILLPFILLEIPAGKIADNWIGEKELLILGFVITAIFISYVPFIEHNNLVFWILLLLMTRIGASLIEIMTESYFFKHVDGDDNNSISFFRIGRPAAYIAGPILATVSLFFLDIQHIWFVLGGITLYGLRYAFALQDTR